MNPHAPTVYIVDDDDAVREALGALLSSVGLDYQPFASAEAFLAVANPHMRGCLLLDVSMPGISGLELQRRLRDQAWRCRSSSSPGMAMCLWQCVP